MLARLAAASLFPFVFCASAAGRSDSILEYISVESKSVHKSVRVGVYLPAGYEGSEQRYPVIVFLHGMFGSERKWEQRGVPEQLDQMIEAKKVPPMIVVCPNGENSMYVNWASGNADWEDFIALELPKAIDAKYRTIADRASRGISGDSMGGFGAINVGFHHPEVFGSISAHSAAVFPVDPNQLSPRIKGMTERWKDVFGSPVDIKNWEKNNPLKEALELDADALKKVKIYFDCGDHDRFGFNETNATLHAELEKRGIPHQWVLREGNHGDEYFRANVEHSLQFHGDVFAAEAKAGEKKPAQGEQRGV